MTASPTGNVVGAQMQVFFVDKAGLTGVHCTALHSEPAYVGIRTNGFLNI